MIKSRYHLHCQAIRPLLHSLPSKAFAEVPASISAELQEFITVQGLAGHWYQRLGRLEEPNDSQKASIVLFRDQIRLETARYLAQLRTIHTFHKLFENNDIRYILYKGTHIRDVLYDPPSIRPAVDIDVLISPRDRERAVDILINHGFEAVMNLKNINVEASFCYMNTTVDLHWNLFRSKRSRVNLVEPFLAGRIKHNGFYCPSAEHALVVMLTHPVFFKYLTTPISYLSRIVDIYRWFENYDIRWDQVLDTLQEAHLKTAAWLTGYYCELLTSIPLPEELMSAVKPMKFKKAYLSWWVSNDLSTRFFTTKAIPQIFFTLPAHDSFPDAFRLLLSSYQESKESKRVFAELSAITGNNRTDS